MDAPPVQYVKTSDGYDIAYTVSGSGQPFLIAGTSVEHVQLEWEHPGLKHWLSGLAARFRLIQMDHRGAGMSTRGLPDDLSMDDFQLDIKAVVDHLKLDRFVVYGAVYGPGYHAVQYAVENAGKVTALILSGIGSTFRAYRAPALYEQLMTQDWDLFVSTLTVAAVPAADAELRHKAGEIFKRAFEQRDMLTLGRAQHPKNMEQLLERLKTPTLVLHPRDFGILPPEEPMKVARLARGRLVTIDGAGAWGDAEQGIRAIETFLADLPPGGEPSLGHFSDLSERELEVLRLLAQGKSNPQIAEELFITRNTVQNHVSSILIKLNLQNRAQAAVYARDHGIA